MKQRRQRAGIKAANDNHPFWNRAVARPARGFSGMPFIQGRQHPRYQDQLRQADPLGPPEPLRIGARPLLIAGFSALVLLALLGAFLLGLAVVGLLALVVGAFELARGQLYRPARPPLGALDHPVVS
jgi:hypothetical protein